MPKVRSLTGLYETVRRWKIYPDGRVEDALGQIHDEVPVEVAFSPQCIALLKAEAVEIEELKVSRKDELLQTFSRVTDGAEVIDEKAGVLRKRRE